MSENEDKPEKSAAWRDDPSGSGLRWNEIRGEWDDTSFLHLAPLWPLDEDDPTFAQPRVPGRLSYPA